MKELGEYLSTVSINAEEWIKVNLKPDDAGSPAEILYSSMLYSLNAGGKKLRPTLLIMGYNLFSPRKFDISHPALPFAVAVEMIHTYSLIHDDLPGMDNDSVRRGKPTNHILYGEATAILAGDGLLTKAFEIFANPAYSAEINIQHKMNALFYLLKAVGPDGMVGGQYADMAAQGSTDLPQAAKLSHAVKSDEKGLVNYIHTHKTADFIRASLVSGALLAGVEDMRALSEYGAKVGLAFQIVDDILDKTVTTEQLGKTAGADDELDKLTYPKAYGLEKSRETANELVFQAKNALNKYGGDKQMLIALADYICNRKN